MPLTSRKSLAFSLMKNGAFTHDELRKIGKALKASYVSYFEFEGGERVGTAERKGR